MTGHRDKSPRLVVDPPAGPLASRPAGFAPGPRYTRRAPMVHPRPSLPRQMALAAVVGSTFACVDDVVSDKVAPGLTVKDVVHTFNHHVGNTDCPQKIGTMKIVNRTGGPVSFRQVEPLASVRLEPAGGEISTGTTTVTLTFTCSPAASFDGELVLEFADDTNAILGQATIFVEGRVG